MPTKALCALALVASIPTLSLSAQMTPITLNYNFNGLVHAGEAGNPDAPNGFRSISDRALLVDGATGSFGTAPVVGATGLSYTVVTQANVLDIVHLGNRAALWPYEASAPGTSANVGIRPDWDTNPDHTTPQITSGLNIPMFANTEIGFLYQVSNAGNTSGTFQVVLGFSDSTSVACTLAGPDWFQTPAVPARNAGVSVQQRLGTTWPATNSNDLAGTAPTNQYLNVIEGIISVPQMITSGLGDQSGKTLTSITFQNATYPTNTQRGYAIIAATARGSAVFPPSAIGSATPSPVAAGNSVAFSVAVTPGSGSNNGITSVTVDASSLSLGTVNLVDGGSGTWSSSLAIPADQLASNATVGFTVRDAQNRTATGTISFQIIGRPNAENLGTLTGTPVTRTHTQNAGDITWYKFTLPVAVSDAAQTYLDIDTEGSSLTATNFADDTEIGLYDNNGNRIADDDDDGTGFTSQLTFGQTTPPRPAPSDGLTYNGRDGSLAAGTYYLCATAFNATFGNTAWTVTTTSAHTGTIVVNLKLGIPGPVRCNEADVAGLGGTVGPDNQISADDLIVFLAAYFAENIAIADIAGLGGTPGGDGQLSVDDLVFFLSKFFTPCP
jgi:hypothetical protein